MSNVRFTNDILSRQTLFDLGNITDTLAKTQNELSTGKRITKPEDDPYGAGRAVSLRNQLGDVQQYQTNINDASAWAQTTDSALGNVTDLLQRARELVVQAADHGNGEPAAPVEDLGNAGPRPKNAFKILARQALLLHAKFDRLDRIGHIHAVALAFVGVDQCCKHVQPIALRCVRFRAP